MLLAGDGGEEEDLGEPVLAQQQHQPFTRLNCACVFLDSARTLELNAQRVHNALGELDPKRASTVKEAVNAMRAELAALRRSHDEHVTVVGADYLRAMMELSKVHEINPHDQSVPGLQVGAYRRGDLTKLRNPPKKLTKKDKAQAAKKRNAQQAAKARKRTSEQESTATDTKKPAKPPKRPPAACTKKAKLATAKPLLRLAVKPAPLHFVKREAPAPPPPKDKEEMYE